MTKPDDVGQIERDQACAEITAAIVRLSKVVGVENAAHVLNSVAADIQEHLKKHADVVAAAVARKAGGLH